MGWAFGFNKNKMKATKKLKVGDVFYLKVEDHELYVFGRILFDVNAQYNKTIKMTELSEDYHPIFEMFYQGFHLVEMYDGIFESINDFSEGNIIIKRAMVQYLNRRNYDVITYGKVKNIPVDYTKVEFPENIDWGFGKVCITRGELRLKTALTNQQCEEINLRSTNLAPRTLLHASLDFQNRRDLIPDDMLRAIYLKNQDLLYNQELRKNIYNSIHIDPNKSYDELSKEMGLDFGRFY